MNGGLTSLGHSWWVLLCGSVGTWIFGQGLGGEVVTRWHLPTLGGDGGPQEAPVSLPESPWRSLEHRSPGPAAGPGDADPGVPAPP